MEMIECIEMPFQKFLTSSNNGLILFYTPGGTKIKIYCIESLKLYKQIDVGNGIVNITFSNTVLVLLYIDTVEIMNLCSEIIEHRMYILGSSSVFLLRNGNLLAAFPEYIKFYNAYNQEETKYYYDFYKVIDESLILYSYNGLVTVMNENYKVLYEKRLYRIYPNLSFCFYKKGIVYMNGYKILSKSHNYDFKSFFGAFSERFEMSERCFYLVLDKKIYVYDRKENRNIGLNKFADYVNFGIEINNLNHTDTINKEQIDKEDLPCIEFEDFNLVKNLLFVQRAGKLYKYREYGNDDSKYIIAARSYDYLEAECDFDRSSDSIH